MKPTQLLRFVVCLGAALVPGTAQAPTVSPVVSWHEWSAETFARAKAENRPILVNVAAAWCHWCHVMDERTFAQADVARLLNERFMAVRVDADARPDVAERYADWGWPADAILTPDAKPVTERRGFQEPDVFLKLLQGVVRDLDQGKLSGRQDPLRPAVDPKADLAAVRDRVAARLDSLFDDRLAGWGRTQKYPLPAPIEEVFWRAVTSSKSDRRRALDTLTAETKLIDPVFGGMYQYSVPDDWDHPHFEKLASIQAGALQNLADAFQATRTPVWLARARDIHRYVAAFLTAPDGTFYVTQDADVGAHPGDTRPFVDGHTYYALNAEERRRRGIPRVDEHVYADANGQLIHAYARLFDATADAAYRAIALRAAERVIVSHAAVGGGFNHGSDRSSGVLHLADQAWMGRALLRLYESTGDSVWLARSQRLAAVLVTSFLDLQTGAFFASTVDPAAVGSLALRRRPLIPNAVAARFLVRLGRMTNDEQLQAAGERCLRAFAADRIWQEEGRFVGEYLLGLDELLDPWVHVAIAGPSGDAAADGLVAALRGLGDPRVLIDRRPPEGGDATDAAAYVCTMDACSAPLRERATLLEAVRKALR